MRKNLLALIPVLALIAGAALLNGCGGDEDPAPPTATFTYEADGREVTFTNTSTGATTYAWDFGDGETSTEENPTHTYDVFGKYTVKLTVTGGGGSATSLPDEITLAKTSAIAVDGTLSDWSDIPVAISSTSDASGTITKLKTDYDANYIYIYVEGTANLRGFFDIYFNTDNDTTSGYTTNWYPEGFGADYFTEGNFAVDHDAPFFNRKDGFAKDDWAGWQESTPVGSNAIKSSDLVTVGSGKAIEIRISRSVFTNLSDDGFAFAVVDVAENWTTLGTLPVSHIPEVSKLQFVDLTK